MGNRAKFAAEIGQCASMEKVEGELVIQEENDNVFLSVISEQGFHHGIHEFFPKASIWKKVSVSRKGIDLIIRFLG